MKQKLVNLSTPSVYVQLSAARQRYIRDKDVFARHGVVLDENKLGDLAAGLFLNVTDMPHLNTQMVSTKRQTECRHILESAVKKVLSYVDLTYGATSPEMRSLGKKNITSKKHNELIVFAQGLQQMVDNRLEELKASGLSDELVDALKTAALNFIQSWSMKNTAEDVRGVETFNRSDIKYKAYKFLKFINNTGRIIWLEEGNEARSLDYRTIRRRSKPTENATEANSNAGNTDENTNADETTQNNETSGTTANTQANTSATNVDNTSAAMPEIKEAF